MTQTQQDVVSQLQENFERAQQEFMALLQKVEEDPKILLNPEHQTRLNELNALVTETHRRAQSVFQ